ncbi:MAG: serine/threonine-protein kinase [Kiritimatiellia bacterium]|jgi:serine/threonine protein kinase|nr:serine/threonine-protein kinase [Kiritimatiellia bacterium]
MSTIRTGDILLERFDAITCSQCSQPIDTSAAAPFTPILCPACGTEMRVPARFANFILLDPLGKGGMGAVYKAYDETLGRTVAIKVMQQSIGQDRVFVEQFLQEARALAAINNPHIVQIYSYGEENEQPYIVMELVDGGRLDHIQVKHKALDEVFVLETALQIIRGLQAANAAGMTHGDIKPANILYDRDGNAKVADFGLARFKGEKPKPGEIWGTPYYVAPEVVKGQAPNAGSDIYSLGGTLYHVLTGEPPFNCETVTDTVLLRFKEPPPDPREFKKDLSAKTTAILLRTLEMDPFARYPTYESLHQDMSDALERLRETRSGKKAPPKKNPAVSVVFGLLALAFVVSLSIFGWGLYQDFTADKIERQKKEAQFEADKAAGRIKQVFRGGQLQWVRVITDDAADADATAPAAPVNEWTLAATMDVEISGDNEVSDMKDLTTLTLCAGSECPLEKASKIYLQFSLAEVDRKRLASATLQITAGRRGRVKVKANPYELFVWALKRPQEWTEFVRWETAPGNDPTSISLLNKEEAVLLTSYPIPANPETGDRLPITSRTLLTFIRDYPDDTLTLILTADDQYDHKNGWRITATEDAARFPPPTLILKAK